MTPRQRVLDFLAGKPVDRLPLMPVVMMFCADRLGVKYGDYVRDEAVLAEAQIRTAEEFDLDIVSNMSDPAREAADCGAAVQFYDDQPAALVESDALLAEKPRLAHLRMPDPYGGGRMHAAIRAIERMRERVGGERAVMGWVEGPCAEAADLRGINTLMLDFYDDPAFVTDLFEFVLELALAYGKAQIAAGADIIGIGDAAASLVGPRFYAQYVWPVEKRLVEGLQNAGTKVRLHICGNTTPLVADMGRLGCEIVDLDYFTSVAAARQAMGPQQILLGNLDPVRAVRNATPPQIREAIAECHAQAGARYIVGVGCEVPRDTPLENMQALRDYARETLPTAVASTSA